MEIFGVMLLIFGLGLFVFFGSMKLTNLATVAGGTPVEEPMLMDVILAITATMIYAGHLLGG